ncbi:MAG TPA: hypothetical protein VN421_03280 [Pseudoflavonifractor sp.]|nr:hypothetical protein [Pseudoflavonifractor sp.]
MTGAEKHYAGRWICQKPAEKCNGMFRVYGEDRPCPLAPKCLGSPHYRGQLETIYAKAQFGKLAVSSSQNWGIEHVARLNDAKAAFSKDAVNAYYREYAAKNRDRLNRLYREKYNPSLERMLPGVKRLNAPKEVLPPCGGDCENCPYDAGCRYPGFDAQQDAKRETKRICDKRYAERRKERMKADPVYAERERSRNRGYQRVYRERKRSLLNNKNGGKKDV